MEHTKKTNINFILLLAIFFAFITLLLISVSRIGLPGKVELTNQVTNEDAMYVDAFGFEGITPKETEHPVVGTSFEWVSGDMTLELNNAQVIYRNKAATRAEISDTKVLQDIASEYVQSKKLVENVTLDYEKSVVLVEDGSHLEEVEDGKNGEILELMFVDLDTGEDKVRVRVTGAGEILEVLVIRS